MRGEHQHRHLWTVTGLDVGLYTTWIAETMDSKTP